MPSVPFIASNPKALNLRNVHLPDLNITRFRWATCQIETIRDCRTVAEIEKALDDLPETLDDTYERVLEVIWKMDAEKGRAIFTWLLFSERPLTTQEMAEAAVIRPGDMKLSPRDRLTHFSGVLSICRSLVTLSDEEPSDPDSIYTGDAIQRIRFAHFSVKEYLISGRSKAFTGMPVASHQYIGNCCISILLPFDHPGAGLKNKTGLMRNQYLLWYAAASWFFHIKQLEALDKVPEEMSSGVCKLLDHGPGTENTHAWMEIWRSNMTQLTWAQLSRIEDLMRPCLPPLFYACRLGLVGETDRYIKTGADVNQYVVGCGTPLHMATKQENHKVTEMLLRCGADAKIRDHKRRTAFGRAASFGDEETWRLLLGHGIDINRELDDAVADPDIEAFHFLLDHGANSNRALQRVACQDEIGFVHSVIKKCTDLNAHDYTCALLAAAKSEPSFGSLITFKRLLERRASISAIGRENLDIILAAVQGGNLDIVSVFVDLGIDINASGYIRVLPRRNSPHTSHSTPLQYASYTRNRYMIKHLLNHGAELNRPGLSLGTELQAAIRSQAEDDPRLLYFPFRPCSPVKDTLDLLIERGADVNQQVQTRSLEIPSSPPFRKKGTALQQAAAQGLDSITQTLVNKGAEVNAQHNHCGTALMCASRHSEPTTLQVLIDMNADVNAQVAGLGSALSEAAKWGRCENVQFLIEKGADVNAEVERIGTALLTALQHGQFETAVVLIEGGADLHAAIQDISRAFSTGSEHEGREIIKLCFESYHPYPKAWHIWDRWDCGRKIRSWI